MLCPHYRAPHLGLHAVCVCFCVSTDAHATTSIHTPAPPRELSAQLCAAPAHTQSCCHLYNLNITPSHACVPMMTLVGGRRCHLHRMSHYVDLFVKQNAHMCTHVCVCLWRVFPPRLSPQTPRTASACWRLSPAPRQTPLPPPPPACLQRHPHNGASRVDVCSPAFYFAHCSVTAARSQLPPLPQRRSFGDIKGKPEKGYLEKRVARQPNTHHPGAPPTQNSVPGLQPD